MSTRALYDNTDCNLVGQLWNLLNNPGSGEWYLGNIINNGLKVPSLGIDIAPFPTVQVGDIPNQTMFEWALEYLGVAMSQTVLSGLGTFDGGKLTCTAVSSDTTQVDLTLDFARVMFAGNYDVGTSGVTGCAIVTASAILGGPTLPEAAPASDRDLSRLELAAWYRDDPLNQSSNGQTAVGAYYLHQDTIQTVTTDSNNYSAQYRQALAAQKTTSDAVTASTLWYEQQKTGQTPVGPEPRIGDGTQYAGGFNTAVKLQAATYYMMSRQGLRLAEGDNEYAELMNSMEHFNDQVLDFQRSHPGEQDTSTILDYVADAQPAPASEVKPLGERGIPVFDLDTGEIVGRVPTWPVDRERMRRAWAARAPRAEAVDAPGAWFHIKGTFSDIAQAMSFSLSVTFTAQGTGLVAAAKSVQITIGDLKIILGNKEGFDSYPTLYDRVSSWIANTSSFQDTLKSKLNGALNSPAVLAQLSAALNAGLKKLGLQQ